LLNYPVKFKKKGWNVKESKLIWKPNINYSTIWTSFVLSPSQRRGASFRALARGESTNSDGLFATGEREAIAKSKVHQWSRAWVTNRGWSSSLILKIWLFARSGISKISIFKSIYLEKHVSYNELWSNFLKKLEELIYCGKSWNIRQVCFDV
jgi:hypothetical protein